MSVALGINAREVMIQKCWHHCSPRESACGEKDTYSDLPIRFIAQC